VHDGKLQLNDFDISCFDYEIDELSVKPVGTRGFWSPRCDADADDEEEEDWLYSESDDWLGLALTFAFWYGVYTVPKPPADFVALKLGAMRKLLAIEHVPMALKNRLMPVVEEVAKELGREFE
jgi:hypothetical protein